MFMGEKMQVNNHNSFKGGFNILELLQLLTVENCVMGT